MPADLTKPFAESCCDGGECYVNDNSAQPCGCDKGANWICQRHQDEGTTLKDLIDSRAFALADKPSNPKDIIGSTKVPMGLVPPITMAYLALGHLEGDLKYGRVNWREAGVRMMIYVDACLRHLTKLRDGEWADPVTTVPHLANALCCLSIIVDAHHAGKLIDDRPKSNPATSGTLDALGAVVKNLQELFKDKKPIDYLITGPKERE